MWIFINIITFLHGRFVYVHTFFHRQIMCGCRLITCLYDILQISYERRLHYNHVAPSVLIWAEFAFTLDKDMPTADSGRHACSICLRSVAAIIYRHILLGENSFNLIRTRTHEKIRLDFFRADPLYVLYIAGKNVKNCKVRSCLCPLDPSIFHFILIKYGGKIWQLEPSNLICKKWK